ncbi:hypothetical protein [Agromyces sp. PvR057]|uniref:hypothetical protein n=1 Tax=Agromyces sp. PvR057 TaxID=3156403 RepID=UPI003399BE58
MTDATADPERRPAASGIGDGAIDGAVFHDPGRRAGDGAFGRHGDVVVDGDRGVLVSFTHPHRDGSELGSSDEPAARASAIFAEELRMERGRLVCDRDAPVSALPEA